MKTRKLFNREGLSAEAFYACVFGTAPLREERGGGRLGGGGDTLEVCPEL